MIVWRMYAYRSLVTGWHFKVHAAATYLAHSGRVLSLLLLHHRLLNLSFNLEHFLDERIDLVEVHGIILFQDAKALHVALQLHDKLKFLLGVVNLVLLLRPDGAGNEETLRQKGAFLDRFLDESHEEKWAERLLVWYQHCFILRCHSVEIQITIQEVIVVFGKADPDQFLLLNNLEFFDRVPLWRRHLFLELHNFIGIHALIHF